MPKCNKCNLYKNSFVGYHTAVKLMGRGAIPADFMVVGDFPSPLDIKFKKIFSDTVGDFLIQSLSTVGISLDSVYFSTVIKCKAPANRPPTTNEIQACFPYLEEEIARVKPKVICLLGSLACKAFGLKGNLADLRGNIHISKAYPNIILFPTYHPSYVLRFTKYAPQRQRFLEDMAKLPTLLNASTNFLDTKLEVIDTIEKLKTITTELSNSEWVAIDTETTSLEFLKAKLLCFSFSNKPGRGIVIPYNHPKFRLGWEKEAFSYIQKILNSSSKKIFQGGKFDLKILFANKFSIKNFAFDTMLAHYLLNEMGRQDLESLSRVYTNMPMWKDVILDYITGKIKIQISKNPDDFRPSTILDAPLDKLFLYAGKDADATYRIFQKTFQLLKEKNLSTLFFKIVIPLSYVLATMEFRGILGDYQYAKDLQLKFESQIKTLFVEMYNSKQVKNYLQKTGLGEFNFKSSKQLRELLYDELGLKPVKYTPKTKTCPRGRPSTDKEALELLYKKNKIKLLENIINYRKNLKFLDYIKEYKTILENSPDKRIHTSFSQSSTKTGRLSSSHPNLQNVPKHDKTRSKLIRDILIASPGYTLAEIDYSQIEFRIWAHCSNDKKMIEAITNGVDIHKLLASQIYGIPMEKVSSSQRSLAKTVVYGLMYGRGEYSIAQEFGLSKGEVRRIINGVFEQFSDAANWISKNIEFVKKHGYIRNMFGRIRRLDYIFSKDEAKIAEAERQTRNFPIQSGAADLCYLAMIKVYKYLTENNYDAYLLLQIHDSLVFEIKDELVEFLIPQIVKCMTTVVKLRVPLEVDVDVGKRLGSMEKYKLIKEEK